MADIYRYKDNEFDKDVVYNRIARIEEQIEELEEGERTEETKDQLRKLMYAQFIQGLKLSTGNNMF